jgi:hypothetical protein
MANKTRVQVRWCFLPNIDYGSFEGLATKTIMMTHRGYCVIPIQYSVRKVYVMFYNELVTFTNIKIFEQDIFSNSFLILQ